MPILRFSEILPEGRVPRGIIILTRETKIAEMNLSEPFKNDFQFSDKSVQKKLKMCMGNQRKSEKIKNLGASTDLDTVLYLLKKTLLI